MISEKQKGVIFIETILYVGIVSVLAVFLTYSVAGLIRSYKKIQIQNEVLGNVAAIFSVITEEVKSARSVYEPTSIFGEDEGQLSLKTFRGAPDGEYWTYVDFYLDNQRVYLKREGVAAFSISSEQVSVSRLKFTRIGTGTTTPSVKIDLSAGPNLPADNPFYFVKNYSVTAGLR